MSPPTQRSSNSRRPYRITSRRTFTDPYRSDLERGIAQHLECCSVKASYEPIRIQYTIPASEHLYTPDFILPNGIIIEAKGLFVPEDRRKHELIHAQFPDLDIRFVFSNPNQKIRRGSKTSYGDWCTKRGFLFAKQYVPLTWIAEDGNGRINLLK